MPVECFCSTGQLSGGNDHKLEDLIMDVLGTDITGLPMFLLTKYITHAHRT